MSCLMDMSEQTVSIKSLCGYLEKMIIESY